jgi:hypothetical protein
MKEDVKYSGDISLDHMDGFYRSGETAHCRVLLRRDGRPLAGAKARLRAYGGDITVGIQPEPIAYIISRFCRPNCEIK